MQFTFLLGSSIIISILAFCFCVDLLVKYKNRPKTKEDKLVDDLINDIITFEEFDERLNDLIQKERINKLKKERIDKLKKNNQ